MQPQIFQKFSSDYQMVSANFDGDQRGHLHLGRGNVNPGKENLVGERSTGRSAIAPGLAMVRSVSDVTRPRKRA